MAEAGTAQVSGDQAFTRSAGKQLGLYAFYTLLAMSVLLYLLSVAAGSTASGLGSWPATSTLESEIRLPSAEPDW